MYASLTKCSMIGVCLLRQYERRYCSQKEIQKMKISTQTRYAVRFLCALACQIEIKDRVTTKEIAQKEGLSEKYLESIASKLCKAGYIQGKKGIYGGYQIIKPVESISLCDIAEVMESNFFVIHCVSEPESNCKNYVDCCFLNAWNKISDTLKTSMQEMKLSDFLPPSTQQISKSE